MQNKPSLLGNDALVMLDGQDLQQRLATQQTQLATLAQTADPLQRAALELELASTLAVLSRGSEAWPYARTAFDAFLAALRWQEAVEACEVLYHCEQPASIPALGMGIWLAVSFPITPQTSVAMLQHLIDETPPSADGAAVAATVAHYIADLRCQGEQRDSLMFLTTQIIAQVAKRHSQITTQEQLNLWLTRLQLDDPSIFLPRLAKVIEAIVEQSWWFDRDDIRKHLPAT